MSNDTLTAAELVKVLRECTEHGQATWARAHGVSETLVSLVLAGKQKPGPKIARALGYQKKVVFAPLQTQKRSA